MKPIDKKDLPKLLGLVALAFTLFGFAAFQFFVASVPTAKPAVASTGEKPGTAVASATAVAPGATPAPSTPGGVPAFDLASLPPPTGGNDPFLPLAGTSNAPTPPAPSAPSAPLPTPAPAPALGAIGGLPLPVAKLLGKATPVTFDATPKVDGPTPRSGSGLTIQPVLPAATPEPPPAYTVTGVVMGDREAGEQGAVAILRGGGTSAGGSDRRFVAVGDPVGNGFSVAAVRPDGVELKSGNRRVTLKLGGNAPRATAPTN